MSEATRSIAVYCEDSAHEHFVQPLLQRLATEERAQVRITVQSGRGGSGRAVAEFKAWQYHHLHRGAARPDLLVLLIDANCCGPNDKRRELMAAVHASVAHEVLLGTPDPPIERWVMADPEAFQQVIGLPAPPDPGKCERGLYKRLLDQTIERSGLLVLASAFNELAPDIVAAMDLYKAGKRRPELRRFIDDVQAALRRLKGTPG